MAFPTPGKQFIIGCVKDLSKTLHSIGTRNAPVQLHGRLQPTHVDWKNQLWTLSADNKILPVKNLPSTTMWVDLNQFTNATRAFIDNGVRILSKNSSKLVIVKWEFVQKGPNPNEGIIRCVNQPNRCLHLDQGSVDYGTNITLWDEIPVGDPAYPNQMWRIEPLN